MIFKWLMTALQYYFKQDLIVLGPLSNSTIDLDLCINDVFSSCLSLLIMLAFFLVSFLYVTNDVLNSLAAGFVCLHGKCGGNDTKSSLGQDGGNLYCWLYYR